MNRAVSTAEVGRPVPGLHLHAHVGIGPRDDECRDAVGFVGQARHVQRRVAISIEAVHPAASAFFAQKTLEIKLFLSP